MKKFITILLAVLLCFAVASCDEAENPDVTPTPDETQSVTPTPEEEDGIVELIYPNKTRIVWSVYQRAGKDGDQKDIVFQNAVNEYLDSLGCDLYIDFDYSIDFFNSAFDIESAYEQKYETDIVMTGWQIEGYDQPYQRLAKKGAFYLLNDFFNSEKGKTLYDFYGEKFWNSLTVDGAVYGISASQMTNRDVIYIFNDELLKKYDLSPEDFSGDIEKDKALFEKVYNGESANEGFVTIVMNGNRDIPYADVTIDNSFLGIKSPFEGDELAVNIYEQEDVVEKFNTYYELANKGLLKDTIPDDGKSFFVICSNHPDVGDVRSFVNQYFSITTDFNKQITVSEDVTLTKKAYDGEYYVNSALINCTAVTSWSKNAEKAMELLALVYTDKTLADLLRYGVEGETYDVVDGVVIMKSEYGMASRQFYFSSDMLVAPCYNSYNDIAEKNEVYRAQYENAVESKLNGFYFIDDSFSEITKQLRLIEFEYEGLWNGTAGDPETVLKELNSRLYEAGLNDLLQAVNEEAEKWIELQK